MSLMNQSEYARHRGISKQAVSKLVQNDLVFVTPDGFIDPEISDLLLEGVPGTKKRGKKLTIPTPIPTPIEKKKPGRKPSPNPPQRPLIVGAVSEKLDQVLEYPRARAALTKYKAELARIELEIAQGKLIRASDIEHDAYDCARKTRDRILGVVDRIAGVLAAEIDEVKVREILDKELRDALSEVSSLLLLSLSSSTEGVNECPITS